MFIRSQANTLFSHDSLICHLLPAQYQCQYSSVLAQDQEAEDMIFLSHGQVITFPCFSIPHL